LYNDYAVMSLYDGAQLLIAMLLVISAGRWSPDVSSIPGGFSGIEPPNQWFSGCW
jgi:hypothetical protein